MSEILDEPIESAEHRRVEVGRFSLIVAAIAVALAAIPLLFGLAAASEGSLYLQQQTALDDQMVYAAWMKQAQEGAFMFRNLFAVEEQPGLTIHIYFWVLGIISGVTGIPWALTLARLAFSFMFVWMLGRFLIRLDLSVMQSKLALVLACFGAGFGSMGWEMFGRLMQKPSALAPLTNGRLPIDVWQPEAFVFSSMLTSGLFMASLCLMIAALTCVLDARSGWKPVLPGALAFLVLMNIHSYDVLLLALVLAGFLASRIGAGKADWGWVARAAVIGCGALPAAGWFLYVLSQDKVFQARATTLTFSATSAQVLAGLLPLVILALAGGIAAKDIKPETRNALIGLAGGLACFFILGISANPEAYWMPAPVWLVAFAAVLAFLFFLKEEHEGRALLWAWAAVAVVAIYFPGLFQRKLAMGMAVPWAILAGLGMAPFLRMLDRPRRLAALGVGAIACCMSSLLWLNRERELVERNVSSTTTHAPILDLGAARMLAELDKLPGRPVVLAMPGIPGAVELRPEGSGEKQPDGRPWPRDFVSPVLPDLNPMVAGLAGKVAYAGHWSETPDYDKRRGQAASVFLASTPDSKVQEVLAATGAAYALAPKPAGFEGLPLREPGTLGRIVAESERWAIVELNRSTESE